MRAGAHGPVLAGPRVRIEPIDAERARALLAGTPEPALPWEEGFPMPPLLAILRRVIAEPDGLVKFGPYFAYVIVRRSDGLAIGDAGFHGPPSADGEVEIGYALVPRARGSGLATESVGLLAEWALAQPGVSALSARVESENTASMRLLERFGFVADGKSDHHLRYVLRARPAPLR
jgi:RimJ/RimL family protein N-acetyltransferase